MDSTIIVKIEPPDNTEEDEKNEELICRACLCKTNEAFKIFEYKINSVLVTKLVLDISSLEWRKNDGLPETMCIECIKSLEMAQKFREKCIQSDIKLRTMGILTVLDTDEVHAIEEMIKIEPSVEFFIGEELPSACGNNFSAEENNSISNNDIVIKSEPMSPKEGEKEMEINSELDNDMMDSEDGWSSYPNDKSVKGNSTMTFLENFIEKNSITNKAREFSLNSNTNHESDEDLSCKCLQCGVTFPNVILLEEHHITEHPDKTHKKFPQKDCLYYCSDCSKSFKFLTKYMLHMKEHGAIDPSKNSCNICSLEFCSIEKLKDHLRKHTITAGDDYPYNCHTCGRTFFYLNSFKRHMTLAGCCSSKSVTSSSLIFKKSPQQLKQRAMMVLGNSVAPNVVSEKIHKKRIIKAIPEKGSEESSIENSELSPNVLQISHQSIRTEQENFTDDSNNKSEKPTIRNENGETYNREITNHQNRKRKLLTDQNDMIQCPECPSRFSKQKQLMLHMVVHSKDKPFVCDICEASYKRYNTLMRHRKSHFQDKKHICDICKRSFFCSDTLKQHRRIHTGEKPYICTICNRSYTQRVSLLTHIKVHLGEKIYKCKQCSISFEKFAELKEHQWNHYKSCTDMNQEEKKFNVS